MRFLKTSFLSRTAMKMCHKSIRMTAVYSLLIFVIVDFYSIGVGGLEDDGGTATVKKEPENIAAEKADMEKEDIFHHKIFNVIKEQKDLGFTHAFFASLSVIIVSEIGDQTFCIAAIMAMRHSRFTVFTAAVGSLVLMHVLSTILGFATTIIPRTVTYYVSSFLFLLFGLKLLREGYYMSPDEYKFQIPICNGLYISPDEGQEYHELQADLRKREQEELQKESQGVTQDIETGIIRTPMSRWWMSICSKLFISVFMVTFLAEWGDKSQIMTIILGAREDIGGVIIGGALGHTLCTLLAVFGGRFIVSRIPVRTITLIGGVFFILFAVSAFFINPEAE